MCFAEIPTSSLGLTDSELLRADTSMPIPNRNTDSSEPLRTSLDSAENRKTDFHPSYNRKSEDATAPIPIPNAKKKSQQDDYPKDSSGPNPFKESRDTTVRRSPDRSADNGHGSLDSKHVSFSKSI